MIQAYFPYYKRLAKLAIPVVLTQAGQMVVHLVDNAMVGRVGTTELAAASFANSVYIIIMVIGMGMASGVTPLVGQAYGAKKRNKVVSLIQGAQSLAILSIIGLVIIAYAISWLMPLMGQETEVVQLAIPYYRLLIFSSIPYLMFLFLKQIGEGLGNTMQAMIATIVSNIINVILNYFLIFGTFGFPELGLNGAGIATLISRIIMPIVLYFGFIKVASYRNYFLEGLRFKIAKNEIREILHIGLLIALQMFVEVLLFALGAIMVGWIGDVELAAHQVALGVASFTFMIANGVAMATTIRVSIQYGDKNPKGVKMASFASWHLVVLYSMFTAFLFIAFKYQIPRLFTTDELVIKQAASLLVIAAAFQLTDGIQVIALGILRGISDVKVPMFIAGLAYLLVGIPVSYFLTFNLEMGPEGIWWGFVTGLTVAAILLAFRIKQRWKSIENII